MAVDACSPDHRPSCAAASSRAMCLSNMLSAAGTFAALYSASNSRTYGSTNASSSSANSQSALKLLCAKPPGSKEEGRAHVAREVVTERGAPPLEQLRRLLRLRVDQRDPLLH